MRFYVIFTLIFLLMLLATLVQMRRQMGLSGQAFALALAGGVCISALLASQTGGCQVAKPRSSRRTSMLAVRLLPIAPTR